MEEAVFWSFGRLFAPSCGEIFEDVYLCMCCSCTIIGCFQ